MTIVIYYNEAKTCYQVIRPKTDGDDNMRFRGDVLRLVEHITRSNFSENIRNYYKFEVL